MASRAQNERNSTLGKTCRTADGVMFVTSSDALGDARYIKEVDADEKATRFAQEIYDPAGRLTAVHEKFPVDLGHKQM